MSQLTIDLALDNYRSTLSQSYNWWAGSIYVNSVPDVTFPTGKKVLLTIEPEKDNMQVVELDGWDATAKTLNCTWATVKRGEGENYSPTTHWGGSVVKISIPYDARDDIKTAINTKVNTNSTDTDTGKFADATARDAYFTSPVNWNTAYLTSLWAWTDYIGGVWTTRATGSVVNASTTVAGKVEIATQAETEAMTATWWTWAVLTPTAATLNPSAITTAAPAVWDLLSFADISASNVYKSATLQALCDIWRPLATNTEASTWSWTTQSVTPLQLKKYFWPEPSAGTTYTAAEIVWAVWSTWSTSYVQIKIWTIARTGTYTISFAISAWMWNTTYGRIYKNWVAFGTERSVTSTTTTFAENLSFTEWDTISFRMKVWSGTGSATDLSIKYNLVNQNAFTLS